jgi:WD40 repeat protein
VYRAVDTAEGQQIVAIKQITLRGLSTQQIIEATQSFHREVALLSPLRHPGLPRLHETFTDAEHWYLVMDFIAGETLERFLAERPGPSFAETLQIGLQLCTVLEYLHTREPAIIFRDLKPSNIMRTPQGNIFLVDFGIARAFRPGQARDTMPFGSPGYAAPEQYGKKQTTPQADIYSLGAVLHHLLTGDDPAEHPFRFAPLPMADAEHLITLDALIQQMVATEPQERPARVADVRIVLQRLVEDHRWQAARARLPHLAPLPAANVPLTVPHVGLPRRRLLLTALKVGGSVVGVGAGMVGLCELALHVGQRPIMGVTALPPPSPRTVKKQLIYRNHRGAITALSWSPDGTMVASGSADGTVQVWRSADGVLLYTLSGYIDPVTAVAWASDRRNVIASAGNPDGSVQVWDALRDHRDLAFHAEGRVLALDWKPRSPWIVSGGTGREIYTWQASSGARGASYRGQRGDVRAVLWLDRAAVTASGQTSALQTQLPTPTPFPLTPQPPLPTPTPPATPSQPLQPTPSPFPTPALLDYKKLIASGDATGAVHLWDATTGQTIHTWTDHQGGVNGLSLLPSQDPSAVTLASAGDDGRVVVLTIDFHSVWDASYSRSGTYIEHHGQRVNAVTALREIDPEYGALLASAGDDGTVQLWYAYRNEPVFTYTDHYAPVKALALSPVPGDNRMVSGDSNGLVHLWTILPPSSR